MKKNKILMISCVLMGIGAIMAGAGYICGGYKGLKETKGFVFDHHNYEDNDYVKEDKELEVFKNIELNVDFGDVEIVQGDKYRIVSEYNKKIYNLSYDVEDEKLVVTNKLIKKNKVFDFDGGDDSDLKIKIYIPKETCLDNLNLKVNSGNLMLEDLKCKELYTSNDFGNINGKNIETDNFEGNLESGSLNLDTFTAENAIIKNEFGNVMGKSFITNGLDLDMESGKIDISGKLSGKNNINSEFGKINIKNDLPKDECGYDIHVDLGRCLINGNKSSNGKKSNYDHESYNETANNMFKVNCSSGDVELDFNN